MAGMDPRVQELALLAASKQFPVNQVGFEPSDMTFNPPVYTNTPSVPMQFPAGQGMYSFNVPQSFEPFGQGVSQFLTGNPSIPFDFSAPPMPVEVTPVTPTKAPKAPKAKR